MSPVPYPLKTTEVVVEESRDIVRRSLKLLEETADFCRPSTVWREPLRRPRVPRPAQESETAG